MIFMGVHGYPAEQLGLAERVAVAERVAFAVQVAFAVGLAVQVAVAEQVAFVVQVGFAERVAFAVAERVGLAERVAFAVAERVGLAERVALAAWVRDGSVARVSLAGLAAGEAAAWVGLAAFAEDEPAEPDGSAGAVQAALAAEPDGSAPGAPVDSQEWAGQPGRGACCPDDWRGRPDDFDFAGGSVEQAGPEAEAQELCSGWAAAWLLPMWKGGHDSPWQTAGGWLRRCAHAAPAPEAGPCGDRAQPRFPREWDGR